MLLVVDDDVHVIELYMDVARSLGLEAASASDGEVAIQLLEDPAFRPRLVLTDLEMEGVGGEGLVAWLRSRVDPLPRIVMVSGHPDLEEVAARLGVEHAYKPMRFDVLSRLLEGLTP